MCKKGDHINPYPTAFPYGNGIVQHFYQQQESSTTKTVHKVIKRDLKLMYSRFTLVRISLNLNSSQLNMFREIILPIFRSTRLCVTACGVMHTPRCCRPPVRERGRIRVNLQGYDRLFSSMEDARYFSLCISSINYRGADKSLARPDWRNNWKFCIFHPTRRSLLPRRPGWTDKLLNFFWMISKFRVWTLWLVSFLVGLKTY